MAQDDYYYEIQLTNKQLVFYFMAGATALILSFLAGVMVGRGVDEGAGEVQAARTVQEDRVVPEEPARSAPPPAEELTYAQRLEGEASDDSLDKPRPEAAAARPAARVAAGAPKATSTPAPKATSTPAPVSTPAATRTPAVAASPVASPAAAGSGPSTGPATGAGPATAGSFTIQVGAFKDRASADSVMERLKGKGFAAYVVAPEGAEGLFNVRVGHFVARADAERVQKRLRDEEKFRPFLVKQ